MIYFSLLHFVRVCGVPVSVFANVGLLCKILSSQPFNSSFLLAGCGDVTSDSSDQCYPGEEMSHQAESPWLSVTHCPLTQDFWETEEIPPAAFIILIYGILRSSIVDFVPWMISVFHEDGQRSQAMLWGINHKLHGNATNSCTSEFSMHLKNQTKLPGGAGYCPLLLPVIST